jgi:gliding motility-associated lipoprotein GldH
VRNTGKYEYSNLYLFVTAHSPNGNLVRDTVEITLADERGKWLGRGAASVFTLFYPYKTNIRFPMRGIYTFDIEQAMWIRDLGNISDIGLRIEKATDNH